MTLQITYEPDLCSAFQRRNRGMCFFTQNGKYGRAVKPEKRAGERLGRVYP